MTEDESNQVNAALAVAAAAARTAFQGELDRILFPEVLALDVNIKASGTGERLDKPKPTKERHGKQEAFPSSNFAAINRALANGARVLHIEAGLVFVEHLPTTDHPPGELTIAWSRNAILAGALEVVRDRLNEGSDGEVLHMEELNAIIDNALKDGVEPPK